MGLIYDERDADLLRAISKGAKTDDQVRLEVGGNVVLEIKALIDAGCVVEENDNYFLTAHGQDVLAVADAEEDK